MKYKVVEKTFDHHRNGWNPISHSIKNKFHSPYGISFYTFLDFKFKERKPLKHSWSGILHNVIKYPENDPKYSPERIFPLNKLVKEEFFIESLPYCKGIFTLSQQTSNYLSNFTPAASLKHPIDQSNHVFNCDKFNLNRKVVSIGQWLRNYRTITQVKNIKKITLKIKGEIYPPDTDVEYIDFLTGEEYDKLLCDSVVLVDYFDVAASNTVLECIARNTPVLTNPLEANIEYLGKDYPFFFNSIEELNTKLENNDLIRETNKYLANMNKESLSLSNFLNQIEQSYFYTNIKTYKIF